MQKIGHLFGRTLLVCAIAVALLAGCGIIGTDSLDEGTLVLTFSRDSFLTVKTIEPTLDMTVATYDVFGTGPGGATFEQLDVASSSVVQASLVGGDWTIDVNAKNPGGTIIAQGTVDVTITPGEVLTADVTVTPVVGTGTLDVEVNWPAGVLTSPAVAGTLTPAGGSAGAVAFTMAGDSLSASLVDSTLSNGYYTLSVQLEDGPDVVWGTVESVRIIAGQVSAQVYALVEDVNRGGFDVTVIQELDNPVQIDFDAVDATTIFLGQSLTVTATTTPVDPEDGSYGYSWYFGGTPQSSTGKSVTVSGHLPGVYWLDLILATTTVNGPVLSSSRIKIIVDDNGALAGALFVATSGVDTNPGTIELPLRTITAAVALASTTAGKDRILVSEGTYSGQVDLADGISIYGGYSADNGWAYSDLYTTTITNSSPTANGLFGVRGTGITTATVLADLTVRTGDNTISGGSNYGIYLNGSGGVALRSLYIVAGNGGNGAGGGNGTYGASGAPGAGGGPGSIDGSSWGAGGGGGSGPGYAGGAGGRGGSEGPYNGFNGAYGAGPGGGYGGSGGGWGDPGGDGGNGGNGANGASGTSGGGGIGGTLIAGLWATSSGGSGSNGASGAGGGGGGGGGGQSCTFCNDGAGNGGGGGGAGGQGGFAGQAGTGGGGSFGLFLANSTGVVLENTSITSGRGGAGGSGGYGGSGGAGGSGGPGNRSGSSEIGEGGNGGNGGRGGNGGHGGGGAGGPSYSVFLFGTSADLSSATFAFGNGGAGGYSPGNSGANGASGATN